MTNKLISLFQYTINKFDANKFLKFKIIIALNMFINEASFFLLYIVEFVITYAHISIKILLIIIVINNNKIV